MSIKIKAPSVQELKTAYSEFSGTVDRSVQLGALRNAIRWFIAVAPFKGPHMVQDKNYQRGLTAGELGLRKDTPLEEADNSMKFALKLFQKAFKDDTLPTVEEAITKLEAERVELEARQAKLNARYAVYLDAVNHAFNPVGISYQIVHQEKNRVVGADLTIRVSTTYAGTVASEVATNLFPVLLREIPAVVRALSIVKNGDNLSIDTNLVNTKLGEVTEAVAANYYQGTRPVVPVVALPTAPRATATTARAPRTYTAPTGMPSSGNLFRPGTLTGQLYDRLVDGCGTSDEYYVEMDVLFAGITIGDAGALVNDLVAKGKKTGVYTLTKSKVRGSVYLTFKKIVP